MSSPLTISFAWSTIGHEIVKKSCENSLKNGKINHAILFCGPSNIGKARLVADFAQMLLCLSYHQQQGMYPSQLPCGHCTQCRFMQQQAHPEVSILTPAEGSATISIDQARAIKTKLSFKARYGVKKIVIVHPVEALSLGASNALLKILEEPTPHTHLFLIAEHEDRILATIRSRVTPLRLRPLPFAEIDRFLAQRNIAQPLRQTLVQLSQGKIGNVIRWLDQPELQQRNHAWVQTILHHLDQFSPDQWHLLSSVLPSKDRAPEENEQLLFTWFTVFRDLLVLQLPSPLPITHERDRHQLEAISKRLPPDQLLSAFTALAQLTNPQSLNHQPQLTIENLLFSLTPSRQYA